MAGVKVTHSQAQLAKIAVSILEFGWRNPVLVDGASSLIAGSGRLATARKLGLDEVPVIELADLTPSKKRALVVADNRLALDAGWDEKMLVLTDLEDGEIESLLAGVVDADEAGQDDAADGSAGSLALAWPSPRQCHPPTRPGHALRSHRQAVPSASPPTRPSPPWTARCTPMGQLLLQVVTSRRRLARGAAWRNAGR